MLRYALKRLLGAVPTLLLVIVLAFLMVHAAPGGPFDDERGLPAEIEANIAAAYDLDKPLPVQLWRYLAGVVRGDLGPSFRYRDHSVSELIGAAFPLSLQLGSLAMLLAIVLGTAAGIWAALHANTVTDRLVMSLAMTFLPGPPVPTTMGERWQMPATQPGKSLPTSTSAYSPCRRSVTPRSRSESRSSG